MSVSTTEGAEVTAEILEASAGAFASAATAHLQAKLQPSGTAGAASWKRHLTHRVLELAAAVRVGDPAIFVSRIDWLRRAFRARGSDESELKVSIESLSEALREELPEDLRGHVAPVLEAALGSLARDPAPDPFNVDPATPEGRLTLEYLRAALEGDADRAIGLIVAAIENGRSLQSIYVDVLIPAQREAGQLWHTGDISIAEEHLVSETTRQLLPITLDRYAPSESHGKVMLAASVAGNAHDLGLRIVTNLFRLAGWRCLFLGADMPPIEVARAAQLFNADLALLNATITTQLKQVGATVLELRSASPGTKILVGGLAFADSGDVWKKFGVDGYAPDALSAIEIGSELVGIQGI